MSVARSDGIGVDGSTAMRRDHPKRSGQRSFRDALPPMIAIDEKAWDPPVRSGGSEPREPTHAGRQLGWSSELTPPDDIGALIDESRVGPIRFDELFLQIPPRLDRLWRLAPGEVECHAPAAVPDAIVLLHDADKVRPVALLSSSISNTASHRLSINRRLAVSLHVDQLDTTSDGPPTCY